MTNQSTPTSEELKAKLLDHFKHTMPVQVDQDYAEHLLDRVVREALSKHNDEIDNALDEIEWRASKNYFQFLDDDSKLSGIESAVKKLREQLQNQIGEK